MTDIWRVNLGLIIIIIIIIPADVAFFAVSGNIRMKTLGSKLREQEGFKGRGRGGQ